MHKKKGLLILKRTLLGILLGLYVLLAALNSTIVQSYLGAAAGSYFTKEWGGKVRIGALHFSPFSHLVLDKIELISPTNDTIYYGDRIVCRFRSFPLHQEGLSVDRVFLRNGRYHFESIRYPNGKIGTNLDFIISHYKTTSKATASHFVVEVGEVRMRNIDYIQDLPESPNIPHYEHGVDIPHMRYYGTTGTIRHVRVDADSVTCRVVSLSTTEASGLRVADLSMDVEVSPRTIHVTNMDLQTADSRIFMDVEMLYHGWDVMKDYCNTVQHDIVIKPGTEMDLCDATYWAPALLGLSEKVTIQGHFYGTIADMHANGVVAHFGERSQVYLDAEIQGLPIISNTSMNVRLHRLLTNYDDLAAVRLPEGVNVNIPSFTKQMQDVNIEGSLKGGLKDCESFFNINSHIGDLEGQAHIQYDTIGHDYIYYGTLDSRTMGIRALMPNEWVSRTGFHLSFQGVGMDPKTMDASLEGRLYNTQFRGHNLERTTLSAEWTNNLFSADITLRDSLIGIDLACSADMTEKDYDADIQLSDAHLTRLGLLESDSDITVSTHLVAKLQGDDLEIMTGNITLLNTQGQIGSRRLELEKAELTSSQNNQYKHLLLDSDWLTASMRGYFHYKNLPLIVRDFCDRYIPTYFNPYREADPEDLSAISDENINLDITWNDKKNTFALLAPEVSLSDGTNFHCSYHYGESLKTVFRTDMIAVGKIVLQDMGFNSSPAGDNYQLRMKASNFMVGENSLLENLYFTASAGSLISTLALKWDNNQQTIDNEGDLEFFITSTADDNKIMISRPTLYLKGNRWSLVCPKGILANNDRISVDELKVYGLKQSAIVNAYVAKQEDDYVRATFDGFSLGQLCASLLPKLEINVDGTIDGALELKGISGTPYLTSNLVVDNCSVNGQAAGTWDIRSNYKTDEGRLYIDLQSRLEKDGIVRQPLTVQGFAQLTGKEKECDMEVGIENVSLQTIKPFIVAFASEIDGTVGGQLRVNGSLDAPVVNGQIGINRGLLKLIPTGVTYCFNDTLAIQNSELILDNFGITDLQNNRLQVDGAVSYENKDLLFDLNVQTDGIAMLDLPASHEYYYGQLFGSVNGTVTGSLSEVNISANASALEGSELYVPVSNKKEINDNDFVIFVNPDRTRIPNTPRQNTTPRAASTGLNLELGVTVTSGMKLHLPMDFDQLAANVTAVGIGDLRVSVHGGQEPSVLGDYQFTSGNFSLTLMQLISKNFSIEQGSTLNFPGNINDAQFNINAVYNLRANLASLMGSDISDNYVSVQDVISLSGTMNEPSIKFDIRLPNAEQSITDQVFSYIDKKNEMELLNQSLSLLILGQFTPSGISNSSDATEGFNGVGLLTSTFGSLVSSMVKVVDVGFKYQAATANTNSQWDVGISKRWNKLYFESTFGYGSNSDLDATMSNVLVGDVEMGYRFSPFFNFYGFHRTNTSYFTRNELPYKQGVGIKLTRDFDSFYDLFPWLKPKEPTDTTNRTDDKTVAP